MGQAYLGVRHSASAFLSCAFHSGCAAQFHPEGNYTSTRGARVEARKKGWLVNQEGGRRIGRGRYSRLDYCSEHAPRERERRGLDVPSETTETDGDAEARFWASEAERTRQDG